MESNAEKIKQSLGSAREQISQIKREVKNEAQRLGWLYIDTSYSAYGDTYGVGPLLISPELSFLLGLSNSSTEKEINDAWQRIDDDEIEIDIDNHVVYIWY